MRDQLELRGLDPVGRCLIRRLTVPRIYYDADWPGLADGKVDLLAIDRDGVGDAHLVEIRRSAVAALACAPRLLTARAPYRWIAFLRGTEDADSEQALISQAPLYQTGVAGRIGVIEIVEMAGAELGANVRLAAERFPTPAYDIATAYSSSHEAQIQFGG
jgi:hypothetical protein